MPAQETLFVALTADVDPDANRAVPGRPDPVTSGDPDGRALTDATLKGMGALLELLDGLALPATFFYEGRTLDALSAREPALLQKLREGASFEHGCHGWCHEDFAGLDSGLPLGAVETRRALDAAGQAFGRAFGRRPTAFRAPYCRLTPHLTAALPEMGYRYDASETCVPSGRWPMRPYRLGPLHNSGALYELPLTRWRDRRGRTISCYLWQLFEGRRPVRDFLDMAQALRARFPGGLLQLAFHPWHLIVSERNQPLSDPVGKLSDLLNELRARDALAFTTVGAYLDQATPTEQG